MSWITDAQQQAAELRKKEAEKIDLSKQERSRLIQLFHQTTEPTKSEIEKIFSKQRSRFLKISKANESPTISADCAGNLFWRDITDSRDLIGNYTIRYAYQWVILETKTTKTLNVYLGVKHDQNNDSMVSMLGISYQHINRSYCDENLQMNIKDMDHLEFEIKKWLVEIFSK